MSLYDDILDALHDDGDAYDLPDGRQVRLRIDSSDMSPMEAINDVDCYGKVAYADDDSTTGYPMPRPAGFDGAAMLLRLSWGNVWWQPTLEAWGVPRAEWHADPERQARGARRIKDILETGFLDMGVEVWHTCPTCHHSHKATVAWLGGIEPDADDEYRRTIISDLLAEAGIKDNDPNTHTEGPTMQYRILHNLTAGFGRPYRVGDVLWPGYAGTMDMADPEAIFARHNRDDRPDGQTAPSLSVGDVVEIEGVQWTVAGVGFQTKDVDPSDILPEGMDYRTAFDQANGARS